MGQQQLLLIVLGTIIVGIAIVLGIYLFRAQAIESKRDIIINESLHIASMAQRYYKKPYQLGGGGSSFVGWDIPNDMKATESGTYTATVSDIQAIIIGTGNELVTDTDSVQVKTTVTSVDIITEIIH